MTHVELVEKILEDYKKEFAENPAEDSEYSTAKEVESFRMGVIFAYQYLLIILKDDYGYENMYAEKGEIKNEP